MKQTNIAFFWHMHQPYYLDPVKNEFLMPWVRLHAIKGYFDMVGILEDFPHIKQTFNIVPSLLKQIESYTELKAQDKCLKVTLKPVSGLTKEEKNFIVENFFQADWDNMIRPYTRYWELLSKRRFFTMQDTDDKVLDYFTEKDIRDLQVWFNLTWFGYMARKKFPLINELIKKGRDFSDDDKKSVIQTQLEVMRQLIPLYKKFSDSGQVELTCSPFYHPILPLLYDSEFASRAMPEALKPDRFSFPEDAKAQIKKGVDYFASIFGEKPKGMWPSEGSVCPELIPFFKECGINWIATDEEILINSINFQERTKYLFKPYRAEYGGSSVNIIFRDRGLSDLIGFTYAKNKPEEAAADFLFHLNNIAEHTALPKEETLVSIILDGENAWEHYHDGGEKFFRLLYSELSSSPHLKTVRVNDFLKESPPETAITNLHSGSWINHSYGIWIGGEEENGAWNILKKVRDFLKNTIEKNRNLTQEQIQKAYEEIYVAEGSDWFWWYGDIFSTSNDAEFDRLFRLHLSNVYTILGGDIPDFLKSSLILKKEEKGKLMEPVGLIQPIIDGKITHFYEWQEAGFYEVKGPQESMHKKEGSLKTLYYGFDLQHFYLRIDPEDKNIFNRAGLELLLNFSIGDLKYKVKLDFAKKDSFGLFKGRPEAESAKVKEYTSLSINDIIEISIPFKDLSCSPQKKVDFFIELKKEDLELERVPNQGCLSFLVPDENFEMEMWSV